MLVTSTKPYMYLIPTMFSTLYKTRPINWTCAKSNLSPANAFNLFFTLSTIETIDKTILTLLSTLLYHTIPTSNDLEKEAFMKTLWEKEKMLVTSIFSFSQNVFYPSQNKFQYFYNIYFVVCKCY